MSKKNLREKIDEGIFFLDGAIGTEFLKYGFEAGVCTEYLNIEKPDVVLNIQKSYIEAGSDAILTNTFGANSYSLERHGHKQQVAKINAAAAEIARRVAGQKGYVLGDIGPTGQMIKPFGDMTVTECNKAFTEQAEALADAGVDGFLIETMTALNEIAVAIRAVKTVSKLPVFASLAYDYNGKDFRTMMGVDIDSAVSQLVSLGVDAVGFNCGSLTLENYIDIASRYAKSVQKLNAKVHLLAEPNAGLPEIVEGNVVYKVTPSDFAQATQKIHSAGVNIIGGCCGTGSEHIREMVKKLT